MRKQFVTGSLFKARKRSTTINTDPWQLSGKTIGPQDHKILEKEQIVFLIHYDNMDDHGIFVFLIGEKIVWQIMKIKEFHECWELIQ
jgi:hypothetical protein